MESYLCRFVVGCDSELGGEQLSLIAITKDGSLIILDTDDSLIMPSSFAWDNGRQLLYVTDEQNNKCGRIGVFSVVLNRLILLQVIPTYGSNPCHIIIDEDKRMIYVSHYSGGGIVRYKLLPTGLIDVFSVTAYMKHEGFHYVLPLRDGFVALNCNGNRIIYSMYDLLDNVVASRISHVSSPRQLVFDSENRFFGVSEKKSQIFELNLDGMKIGKKVSSRLEYTSFINTASTLKLSKNKKKLWFRIEEIIR